jgi:DNA-binding HxlR family transcriptional regulator
LEYTHEKKPSKLLKYGPINNTFEIIGKKFTILILRNMINDKQTRFNQFLNSIECNNPKTLSIRLKDGENGIDREKVFPNETPI